MFIAELLGTFKPMIGLFPLRNVGLVIAIPDHFRNPGISGLKTRNPGIPGLIPGLEFQIYVGKLAVSRIVGKAYYRPTDSKGLISV
jgi:hypothetical protein